MEQELNQHLQDCFALLIITDSKFLTIARPTIKAEYFSSSITSDIVRLCYNFFDQFKEAPKNHLYDEVKRFLVTKLPEEKRLFASYLDKLNTISISNKEYVLSRVGTFVKSREFEEAAVNFVELVEKQRFDEAKTLMYETLRHDVINEDIGIRYTEAAIPTYYENMEGSEFLIDTGIQHLNMQIGGFKRGQLVVLLGGQKGKKSWGCIHLGKRGLMRGLKVLHLSHEMTLPEVEMRYDMMIGGLVSERQPMVVNFKTRDDEGRLLKDSTVSQEIDTVYNIRRIKQARKVIRRFGSELIIRKYPMGSCSMEEVIRYLDYLETFEKFVPDIIINDYIDIMKLPLSPSASLRDRLNAAYIAHKQLADERQVLVITVSQTTRAGRRKSKLTHADFAEDIRKLANVDIAIALSQTEDQAVSGEMGVWVIGNRTGRQDCGCYIQQQLDVGRFCTQSWVNPTRGHDVEAEGTT
jgi:replicative DNA helicase